MCEERGNLLLQGDYHSLRFGNDTINFSIKLWNISLWRNVTAEVTFYRDATRDEETESGFRCAGKCEKESGSTSRFTLDPDPAIVDFDNSLDDSESNASAIR